MKKENNYTNNTEIIIHPKLQHFGLVTANLDTMLDWYHKVLGMTVNNSSKVPAEIQGRMPFSATAFISNDEVHHRMALFEVSGIVNNPDKSKHTRVQHIAFDYETLDDLLNTYARLKNLGILPVMAMDEAVNTSFYYLDPDQNLIELNINNYDSEWTGTEAIRTLHAGVRSEVDPDKMIEVRKEGVSPWEIHERAVKGDFTPAKTFNPGRNF